MIKEDQEAYLRQHPKSKKRVTGKPKVYKPRMDYDEYQKRHEERERKEENAKANRKFMEDVIGRETFGHSDGYEWHYYPDMDSFQKECLVKAKLTLEKKFLI